MKIDKLIKALQEFQKQEGNLDVFDGNGFQVKINSVSIEAGEDYPKDWKMPKKFVKIGEAP